MLSKRALVLGNGESRSSIDLSKIKSNFVTFGCNAIYRDHIVDYLVCCDRRMVKEVLSSTDANKFNLYTKPDWKSMFDPMGIKFLPDLPYKGTERQDQTQHWGSGPYALALAASIGYKDISLLGFDLYGHNNIVNNMYKGTKNYRGHGTPSVNPSYWIYQIAKIFEIYDSLTFRVICKEDWHVPKKWLFPNVSFQRSLDL
jgi:hypothetical protein